MAATPSGVVRTHTARSPAGVLVILALVAASCGGDDGGQATTTTTASPTTVAPTTTVGPGTTTTLPATTTTTTGETTTTTTTATSTTTTTDTLPGEPIDVGPRAGDVLGVMGVAHDDVLNVRSSPGTNNPVIAELDPLADDVVALGRARRLTQSIWYEVRTDGKVGWANSSYFAFLGATDDATASIVDALGTIPAAETMLDLGMIVARAAASDDPPSRIVMSVAPSVGDLGEVTYDVIGLGDDSVAGVRLHVFGMPGLGGEGFTLKSVESTVLCGRGVTAEGICV